MPAWRFRVLKLWFPVAVWCAVIFHLSSIPGLAGPWEEWDFFLRKTAHVTEYAILAFLVLRALQGHKVGGSQAMAWAFLFSLLYAASDEFHQSFVPERTGELKDVIIDSAGCALGIFLRKKLK